MTRNFQLYFYFFFLHFVEKNSEWTRHLTTELWTYGLWNISFYSLSVHLLQQHQIHKFILKVSKGRCFLEPNKKKKNRKKKNYYYSYVEVLCYLRNGIDYIQWAKKKKKFCFFCFSKSIFKINWNWNQLKSRWKIFLFFFFFFIIFICLTSFLRIVILFFYLINFAINSIVWHMWNAYALLDLCDSYNILKVNHMYSYKKESTKITKIKIRMLFWIINSIELWICLFCYC